MLPVVSEAVAVFSALPECSTPRREPTASRVRANGSRHEPAGPGMRLSAVPPPSTTDLCSKPVGGLVRKMLFIGLIWELRKEESKEQYKGKQPQQMSALRKGEILNQQKTKQSKD